MTTSASAQLLIDAIESMEEGIALFDADDRLVLCNQTFRGVFEDSAAPVVPGATFEAMIREIATNGLVADAQEREEEWVRERLAHHRKPSGPIKQYLADGRCLQINEYRTAEAGTISIQADITNFERVEAARQVTEEHTRSIVETVIDGIITFDADGTIETFNPAAETIFGYAADEVLGNSFSILIGDAEQREYNTLIKRYVDEGDQPDFLGIREVMGRRNGGNEFPLEIAVRELRGTWTMHERRKSQRYKFIATLRDISTRKRLAQQLQQAQKMEAIGTLAGGIAHDFNNILSIILGYTSRVLEELRGLEDGIRHMRFTQPERRESAPAVATVAEVRENLDAVMQAGRRARDLVEQILTFSRHTEHEKNPVDLRPVVKEVMKLMRSTLPATIEIKQEIDPSPMVVLADPSQIHQVLMNLCTNAGHAMDEDGGKLSVSLRRAELGYGTLAKFGELSPGSYVHLSIADTGYGMDEATRRGNRARLIGGPRYC